MKFAENWQQQVRAGESLTLKVTPKAKANRIKAESAEDGSLLLRVYVTVVPEDGKANAAVIKLLAKELGIAKSSLTITHGHTGRDKVVRID